MYKYKDEILDKSIAAELIIELFQGNQKVRRGTIGDRVEQTHIDGGGLPHNNSQWAVTLALDGLKALRLANNPVRGEWSFLSIDDMIARFESLLDTN
ncbi:hypothetical protein F4X73_11725 [Candidatus Poribacteria bacterium]|nr:hypothetical protein [Candidatus Poribacteria bacterium]